MKVLEFTLSDFSSLQKELLKTFSFVETSYNYLQTQDSKQKSFFKRVFLESGLEVWILSAQFDEDILIKQKSSNNSFNAIHFLDFDGQFYPTEILEKEMPSKGVYVTNNALNLSLKVNAFENIRLVSFIYSNRWLDINLFNTQHHKNLLDTNYSLKKYSLKESFQNILTKLIVIAQSSQVNGFLLKINTFTLLSYFLDFIENEPPIENIEKFTAADFLLEIEETLSTDFEISVNKIYEEIIKNGFEKKEFIKLFKEKNQHSLYEFRQAKKIALALKLLQEGYQIKEVAKMIGFKSVSKFIEFFKKERGDTPNKYSKIFKIS